MNTLKGIKSTTQLLQLAEVKQSRELVATATCIGIHQSVKDDTLSIISTISPGDFRNCFFCGFFCRKLSILT